MFSDWSGGGNILKIYKAELASAVVISERIMYNLKFDFSYSFKTMKLFELYKFD